MKEWARAQYVIPTLSRKRRPTSPELSRRCRSALRCLATWTMPAMKCGRVQIWIFPDAPVAIRFLPLTPRAPSQRAIGRFVESGYAAVFDDDIELQGRVEVLFANALKSGPPRKSGPDRETLLNSIR